MARMPLPFSSVCDLLQRLSNNHSAGTGQKSKSSLVEDWFAHYRQRIISSDDGSHVAALLSTFLPERRTDRVYNIQARTLQRLFGRALCLGRSRLAELGRWEVPGSGVDLADCIERILEVTVRRSHGIMAATLAVTLMCK